MTIPLYWINHLALIDMRYFRNNRDLVFYGAAIPMAQVPAVAMVLFHPNVVGRCLLAGIAVLLVLVQTFFAVVLWKLNKEDKR